MSNKNALQSRVGRRRILQVVGTGGAALFLAACGQSAAPSAPAAQTTPQLAAPVPTVAAAPAKAAQTSATGVANAAPATTPVASSEAIKRGGTFKSILGTGLPTLNPTLSNTGGGLYNLVYDFLIRYEVIDRAANKYKLVPALAESWQWGEDQKEIVFSLREGVKFHDGSDWNADVAKWNFDLMLTNPKSFVKPLVEAIERAEVVDPMRLRLVLKGPSAPLLTNISSATRQVYFVSKTQFEKLGEEAFGQNPSGTGAMQFASWVREDNVTLKRFDGYWARGTDGKALPYFDGAKYRVIPEAATALAELQTGGLDWLTIDAKDAANVKSKPSLVFDSVPGSGSFVNTLGLNQTEGVFGKNTKLRQAALHAYNRDVLLKIFGYGLGTITPYPFWVEGMLGHDSSLPQYDYDPQKAKQLLAEAGYPNGVDVTLSVIQRPLEQRVSEVIKQTWDSVGIRTKLEVLERTAWINKFRKGKNFDAGFWQAIYPSDPDQNSNYLVSSSTHNWISYSNPDVDKLMADGRTTIDEDKRRGFYKKVQEILYQDACFGVAYYQPSLVGYRKELKGIQYDLGQAEFQTAWLDK